MSNTFAPMPIQVVVAEGPAVAVRVGRDWVGQEIVRPGRGRAESLAGDGPQQRCHGDAQDVGIETG